jgi:anhydro-N-acetylmuramic acid kinase
MVLALGLNSGSSFDGVDAVLVDIENGPDGYPTRPKFMGGNSYPWPDAVAEKVLRAFANKLSLFELCRLNYEAGAVYAESARALMRELSIRPEQLEVIGYDGQTIYQEPPDHTRMKDFASEENLVSRWLNGPYPCGLQIGEPAIVAAACQTTVVTQFRPMDHALGGAGAPLMQYLDYVAFRDIGPVLTLNIGGIANCQLADADRSRMMAFDTGPGNVMLDHVARQLLGKPYDADGEAASRGKVDQKLLDVLLQHPFFRRPPPRSAWRLDFGADYADQRMAEHRHLSAEDLLATFAEFTAVAISRSVTDHVARLSEINLKTLRLTKSDEFGAPGAYKEAIKFATLAHAAVNHLANNIPAASGAEKFAVLGKIVLPPRLAKLG